MPPETHVLGDVAYPLRECLLTPFRNFGSLTDQQKKFNARFSATTVRNENVFACLKARLRQLLHLEFFLVDKMNKLMISCSVLHNLGTSAGVGDVPSGLDDGTPSSPYERRSQDSAVSCGPQTASDILLWKKESQNGSAFFEKCSCSGLSSIQPSFL